MTPEEQKLLADLAARISQTPPIARDPAADDFIRTHIGNRPDALYLMTQTVLIQNAALEQARIQLDQAHAQVQQLQQEAGSGAVAPVGGSFLGGSRPQSPQQGYAQPANPGYPQGGYPPPPPPPGYGAPQPQPGGGGFLRSAATTAAGVAGGMLAFQGVEALLGGLTHGFGGGQGFSGGGFGGPGETIIENNYYDGPRGSEGSRFDAQGGGDSFLGPDPHNDYSSADVLPADDSNDSNFDDSATDDSDIDSSGGDDFSGDDSSGSDSF